MFNFLKIIILLKKYQKKINNLLNKKNWFFINKILIFKLFIIM